MTAQRGGATALRALWQKLHARMSGHDDRGFILLETIVALTMITIIMGAIGAEFVSAVASTTHQRDTQAAAQIGDSEAERVRSLHPSDLVLGRGSTSVSNEFANAPAAVQPWLTSMNQISDSAVSATSGATASLPTTVSSAAPVTLQKPGSVQYSVLDYLGQCYIPDNGTTCVKSTSTGAIPYLRDVIAVTWSGTACTPLCAYVTSTLISSTTDQTFKVNQPLPAAPTVTNLTETVAVGDTISPIQLAPDNGTGVAPFTWQVHTGSSLPTNLQLSPTGGISGTVGGSSGTVTTKIDVTDAFLRSATMTITWTVEPPLTITQLADQASVTGSALSPTVTLSASGGDGSPYTWTVVSGKPTGLSLSTAGVFSGTPTQVGLYRVTVQAVDKGGVRSTTMSFNWNITYPPVSPPVVTAKTSTVNTTIAVPALTAGGGDGNFVWTDPSATLPPGVALAANGTLTGTPTTTGSYNVSVHLDDPTAGTGSSYNGILVTFKWTVVAKPTVTAPADQTNTTGKVVSLQVTATCPNTPCTYALSRSDLGLSVNGTGLISGTISAAAGDYPLTVSVSDAQGVLATSGSFTWHVKGKPTISTVPSAQTSYVGDSASLSYTTSCPNSPCTYTVNNGPSGVTATSNSIGGTVGTPIGTYSVTITVTDAQNISTTSSAFTWTVKAALAITNPGTQQYGYATSVSLDMSARVSGGSGGYTYSASSLPSGLSIGSSTGKITGTTASTNGKSTVTVTVKDSRGVTASTSFTILVSNLNAAISDRTTHKNTTDTIATGYATGGTGTLTYSATGLPGSVTINSSTGVMTGNVGSPSAASTKYSVTVTVTDTNGATATDSFNWYVSTLAISTTAQSTKHNKSDSYAPTPTGGSASYSYSITVAPSASNWLSVGASTGTISGTAPSGGAGSSWTVTVTVTDSVGATASSSFTWSVT